MKNIQLLIESMTRCAGNCSGCALNSSERMVSSLDFSVFRSHASQARVKLEEIVRKHGEPHIESVSLFLGQGDHFLLSHEEIKQFMSLVSGVIPDSLKKKTVVFVTASAIGKESVIQEKMDLFYSLSLQYQIPFFIQTVFDPKKIQINDKFERIYINNILHFKEKCGMTELTINVGEDLFSMKPKDFHQWVKKYGFRHVEMNWVNNINTKSMWDKYQETMFQWLKEWVEVYVKDWDSEGKRSYEINFLPFLTRHLQYQGMPHTQLIPLINETLETNVYIDTVGNVISGQMGLISNLTPLYPRHSQNIKTLSGNKVYAHFLKNQKCCSCEYINVCATSGIYSWPNRASQRECDYGVKAFIAFIKETQETLSRKHNYLNKTVFDKNPVQDVRLIQKGNATHQYFETKVAN